MPAAKIIITTLDLNTLKHGLVYTMKVYSLSDFLTKSQNYFYLMAYKKKAKIRDEIFLSKRKDVYRIYFSSDKDFAHVVPQHT